MTFSEQFETVAQIFVSGSDLSVSTISSRIFDDGKRLQRVLDGDATLTLRSAAGAMQWFSDHWPSDAAWPEGVERPAPSEARSEPKQAEASSVRTEISSAPADQARDAA